MSNLEPCRHCGETTNLNPRWQNPHNWHQVRCDECGALGPLGSDQAEAVDLWNCRSLEVPEEVRAYVRAYKSDPGATKFERRTFDLEMHAIYGLLRRVYGDEMVRKLKEEGE